MYKPENDCDIDIETDHPYKVILFNDETHSQGEVVEQLMKALKCSQGLAFAFMLEAHRSGRAAVFTGTRNRCNRVADILKQIGLGVKVETV